MRVAPLSLVSVQSFGTRNTHGEKISPSSKVRYDSFSFNTKKLTDRQKIEAFSAEVTSLTQAKKLNPKNVQMAAIAIIPNLEVVYSQKDKSQKSSLFDIDNFVMGEYNKNAKNRLEKIKMYIPEIDYDNPDSTINSLSITAGAFAKALSVNNLKDSTYGLANKLKDEQEVHITLSAAKDIMNQMSQEMSEGIILKYTGRNDSARAQKYEDMFMVPYAMGMMNFTKFTAPLMPENQEQTKAQLSEHFDETFEKVLGTMNPKDGKNVSRENVLFVFKQLAKENAEAAKAGSEAIKNFALRDYIPVTTDLVEYVYKMMELAE